MKQRYHSVSVLLFIVLLIITTTTTTSNTSATARKLAAKQGDADVNTNHYSLPNMQTLDSFYKLMGLEYCQNGDEECLKRRAIAEAHLDYIYTQHHKP